MTPGAFPSADQIATAIVLAAQACGENPQMVALKQKSRARHLAYASLISVFPGARKLGLARCCGYNKPDIAGQLLRQAQNASIWDEARVDEIVGALVGDEMGGAGGVMDEATIEATVRFMRSHHERYQSDGPIALRGVGSAEQYAISCEPDGPLLEKSRAYRDRMTNWWVEQAKKALCGGGGAQ